MLKQQNSQKPYIFTGAPNDSLILNTLKTLFRLARRLLRLLLRQLELKRLEAIV